MMFRSSGIILLIHLIIIYYNNMKLKITLGLIVLTVFIINMPLAFADKTITISQITAGEYEVEPDLLYINTGEKVTFHVNDSVITACEDGAQMSITVYADDVFPNDANPIHFTPTLSESDFTTDIFEWPLSTLTYSYSISGGCVSSGLTSLFDISAEFKKNFISVPQCVLTNSCGLSFSLPDKCELISGDPCIPDIPKEIPDPWGPICLTCPPYIQTQYALINNELLNQKIQKVGIALDNDLPALENKMTQLQADIDTLKIDTAPLPEDKLNLALVLSGIAAAGSIGAVIISSRRR